MFIRIENKVINLSLVEQIIFADNTTLVGFTSRESILLDLKHADKLERALSHYNNRGGYVNDEI